MSVIRWKEDGSDVYIYQHYDGNYRCSGCSLIKPFENAFISKELMLEHIAYHRFLGDHVPDYVEQNLLERHVD